MDQHRGPAASYATLHQPLPPPPKNKHWVHDEKTKEWHLEDEIRREEIIIVDATLVEDGVSSLSTDYVLHKVLASDTFQGICLKYKVTPTELRQANGGFSGTNLFLAPNPLRIPKTTENIVAVAQVVGEETPEKKVKLLKSSCPTISHSEAKCYLELNDWNLKEALLNAREDGF